VRTRGRRGGASASKKRRRLRHEEATTMEAATMEGLGLGHGRAVSSFSRAETNSPQSIGSWLCIDGEEA